MAGANDVAITRLVDAVPEEVAGSGARSHTGRDGVVETVPNRDASRRLVDVVDPSMGARCDRPRAGRGVRRVITSVARDPAFGLFGELVGQECAVSGEIVMRVGFEKATHEICRPERGLLG